MGLAAVRFCQYQHLEFKQSLVRTRPSCPGPVRPMGARTDTPSGGGGDGDGYSEKQLMCETAIITTQTLLCGPTCFEYVCKSMLRQCSQGKWACDGNMKVAISLVDM
eukprot:1567537-Amphidinium_carterae.1